MSNPPEKKRAGRPASKPGARRERGAVCLPRDVWRRLDDTAKLVGASRSALIECYCLTDAKLPDDHEPT